MRDKLAAKRQKAEPEVPQEFINVQLLAPVPSGVNQKYKRMGALDSVSLVAKASLESIKMSCIKHFNISDGRKCDILLGERGPSVRKFSEINIDKLIHCRFIDGDVDNIKKDEEEETNEKENDAEQEENTFAISSVPESVSLSAYLRAGQLVSSKKKIVSLTLEEFSVEKVTWKDPFLAKFVFDTEMFASGGYREVYKAKCISGNLERCMYVFKIYRREKLTEIIILVNETEDTHTRKNVQMHMVAHHLAECMFRDAPSEFGDHFWYDKVYYSELDGKPMSVEKYVDKPFKKFVNNNGDFAKEDKCAEMLKSQAFMHYTYNKTKTELMVTDIHGFGYQLTDPEIATSEIKDKDDKWNFCSGNCASLAITNFFENHLCNQFCKLMKL